MGLITVVCFLLLSSGVLLFQQNEYKVIFERMEVVDYNTTFVTFVKTHNFKYNRTNAMTNITFGLKEDLVGKFDVEIQAYKFTSNEYRLFPLRFMFVFCNYAARNEFGLAEMYRCGNLSGCPFKKGVHHICNWAVNGTRFPPHVPKGSYMLDVKLFYRNAEYFFYNLFLTIKYPEV